MAQPHQLAFEAYGVRTAIGTDAPELLGHIERVLPPGWQRLDADAGAEEQFTLVGRGGSSYVVGHDGSLVPGSSDLDVALQVLGSQVRAHVALHAPGLVFVHAGAVAHAGRAIVVPGPSFSGKSTLVAALVHAGAVYLSDEYAVLDDEGLVHPYAKPLSLRSSLVHQVDRPVEELGGTAGADRVPVGVVVATRYRAGASWEPRQASPGDGVLALMANTVPAQQRPAEALGAARRAAEGAVVLEGDRGEAGPVAEQLLAELEARSAP